VRGSRVRPGSDLSQNLAVQIDACFLQTIDETAVRNSCISAGCVDSDHPKRSEIALLAAAADESMTKRALDRFLRGAMELAFS